MKAGGRSARSRIEGSLRSYLAAALLVLGMTGAVRAETYEIDPDRSELVVRLYKAGPASGLAHNHVVHATAFGGRIEFDPEDPASTSIQVIVQADQLEADSPEMRRKYGLTERMSEEDRRDIQATMESARQLDVRRYLRITFESTGVTPLGNDRYQVTGRFTLHGTTRTLRFPVTVVRENGRLRGGGSVTFRQSDFGIEPYSAFLGAVRNRDEVRLIFELVAVPQE